MKEPVKTLNEVTEKSKPNKLAQLWFSIEDI